MEKGRTFSINKGKRVKITTENILTFTDTLIYYGKFLYIYIIQKEVFVSIYITYVTTT